MMEFRLPTFNDRRQSLLDAGRKHGVTIFGAGRFARDLAKTLPKLGIEPQAFVVTRSEADLMDGLPLVSLEELGANRRTLPMWVGVFNHRPESNYAFLAHACHEAGVTDCHFPTEFFELVAEGMGWRYWLTDRRDYSVRAAELRQGFELLADVESKRQLMATLKFRLSGQPGDAPAPDAEPQYFPASVLDLARLPASPCFVDAGAYDGDTILQALQHLPVGEILAFEPDPVNFSALARNLASQTVPAICFPCGVSGQTEILSFAAGQGEASTIGTFGDTTIQVVRLDDCLHHRPADFIKLDIEGHELDALRGAVGLIRRCHPLIAVAAYHKWDDLWRIPQFFRELDCGYQLAYRTHEYNSFDSVFYAYIPR